MQKYAVCFILLQNHSTCFACLPHPSSGVLKTATADSGTGIAQTSPDLATLEGSSCADIMACTGGCGYSFKYA